MSATLAITVPMDTLPTPPCSTFKGVALKSACLTLLIPVIILLLDAVFNKVVEVVAAVAITIDDVGSLLNYQQST
jgi:hypothetical protein